MNSKDRKIKIGVSDQEFQQGVHICQIVSDDAEKEDTLLKFLLSGVQAGERTACFSDKASRNIVEKFLNEYEISADEVIDSGMLSMSGTKEVYFQNDCFEPERMLNVLKEYHQSSISNGYPAARVIGEMAPEVENIKGGERLLEYEARVSMLLRDHPVTAVCQYDAREFSGATLMDILKVHPLMIVKGAVVHNPFFIPPEEILAGRK